MIKDNKYERVLEKRVISLVIIIAIFFFVYTIHLFGLQVINNIEHEDRARVMAQRINPIHPLRGKIYDRNFDKPLAMNINSFAVEIIPAKLPNEREKRIELFAYLGEIINMSPEAIKRRLPERYTHIYQPIEIKSGIPFEKIVYLAENIEQFPAITWNNKPLRFYPDIGSISHILGYVGSITNEELQVLYNKGYNRNSILGKSGIEKQFDLILRGKKGKEQRSVDVHGRSIMFESKIIEVPENGNNLVLTIDRSIQSLAEKALGGRVGSAIVLKPNTGEVLAMVSIPWYDPNYFYTDQVRTVFSNLSQSPYFPFINRTIQSSYPPASSFKLVMSIAAIEEQVVSEDYTVICEGSLRVGDRVFNCHDARGHGELDLKEGLSQSCNVFYYNLGLRYLGIDTINDYSRRLGFGTQTGIDLPGEVQGIVPSPQWKETTFQETWKGGDTVNTSIGQGFLEVTPIQMANMVSMIVNRGKSYRPHIVKEVRDPQNNFVVESFEPEVNHIANISEATFKRIQNHMRHVITHGTARVGITTEAVEVAGKTGTAELGVEEKRHAWFVANAPHGAPPEDQIVVVTMVEAVNEWDWWAIRAANIIFQGIFSNQNYEEAVNALNWNWLVGRRSSQ